MTKQLTDAEILGLARSFADGCAAFPRELHPRYEFRGEFLLAFARRLLSDIAPQNEAIARGNETAGQQRSGPVSTGREM
jgi:hypothetical protein